MEICCPEPNCGREGIKVNEFGVIEFHYPSPKKTLDPSRHCRLSNTKLPEFVSKDRFSEKDQQERKFHYEPGLHAEFNP